MYFPFSAQHIATNSNTLQLTATHNITTSLDIYLILRATRCNTLPHTATQCNTMQHVILCLIQMSFSSSCSTLQHTATHCNTLQQT